MTLNRDDLLIFETQTGVVGGNNTKYGQQVDGWTEVFRERGSVRYLRGGEAVQAARLVGEQMVVVSIPNSANARAVTNAYRMTDANRTTIYNVRAAVPTDDRRRIEITAVSGVEQ